MDNTTLALNTLGKAIAGGATLGQIATQTGLSKASLSLFRNGKYPARPDRVVKKILTYLPEAGPITCPILGEISNDACRKHQAEPFSPASGFQVRLWRTCQTCRRRTNVK